MVNTFACDTIWIPNLMQPGLDTFEFFSFFPCKYILSFKDNLLPLINLVKCHIPCLPTKICRVSGSPKVTATARVPRALSVLLIKCVLSHSRQKEKTCLSPLPAVSLPVVDIYFLETSSCFRCYPLGFLSVRSPEHS